MTHWILNRFVRVDGHLYEPGTPLEQVPQDAQPSIRDTGWATEVDEAATKAPDSPEPEPESPEPEPEPPVAEPEPIVAEPEPIVAVAESTSDDRPLSELGIESDKLDLLAENEITTVQHAKEYVAVNKSFRTIPGIGKAGNAYLLNKLGIGL